jgi:predicted DNA binding CopG/RHH family protein
MAKLDKTEQELLKSYDNDKWVSVDNLESERLKYQEIARYTIQKNKRINIRISEKDLNRIKLRALEEGMPYQTLISSILHKYVSGRLVEKA